MIRLSAERAKATHGGGMSSQRRWLGQGEGSVASETGRETIMAKNNRSASTRRGGCLPMLVIGAAMCLLVIVNGFALNASLGAIAERLPEWLARPKLLQSVAFVMPVFMTAAEWWLVDQFRAVRGAALRRRDANRAQNASE